MTQATAPWPTELRLSKDRRTLIVAFEDGVRHELPAEALRVMSPSAEVQGHSEAERKTVGGKRNVSIIKVDAVGNYAVRLAFDSWAFLRELGDNLKSKFARYLDDLAAKGLDRDRPGVK